MFLTKYIYFLLLIKSGSDLSSSISGLKRNLRDYDTGESGDELDTDYGR